MVGSLFIVAPNVFFCFWFCLFCCFFDVFFKLFFVVVVVVVVFSCFLFVCFFFLFFFFFGGGGRVGGGVWSLFCYAVLSVVSSFAIISLKKRELDVFCFALLCLSFSVT